MLPKIVGHAVGHGKNDVVLLDLDATHDGIIHRCVGAVRTQLTGAVEPVPLFLGFEHDFFRFWSQDDDLRVAELCHVDDGVGRDVVVGAEQGRAGGRRAVPFVGLRSGLFGLLKGSLEVFDGVGFVLSVEASMLDGEGPKVEDQTGPQAVS